MKFTDSTILRLSLGLLLALVLGVAHLAWTASAVVNRVDVLWADYLHRHSLASLPSNSNHQGDAP